MAKAPKYVTELRDFREARALTQQQLANLIEVAQQTLQRYESGEFLPSPGTRARLGTILHAAIDELWPGLEDRQERSA